MDFERDSSRFSATQWQKIQLISRKIEALNSLLNFFESDPSRTSPQACEAIAKILLVDFENSVSTLVQLIETEDGIET